MSDWPEGWYRDEPGQRGSYQAAGGPREAPPTVPSAGRPGGRRWRFWGQPGRRGRRIALIAGTVVVVLLAAQRAEERPGRSAEPAERDNGRLKAP